MSTSTPETKETKAAERPGDTKHASETDQLKTALDEIAKLKTEMADLRKVAVTPVPAQPRPNQQIWQAERAARAKIDDEYKQQIDQVDNVNYVKIALGIGIGAALAWKGADLTGTNSADAVIMTVLVLAAVTLLLKAFGQPGKSEKDELHKQAENEKTVLSAAMALDRPKI